MPITRQAVREEAFNPTFEYPYSLRRLDFQAAMQDVYDFFFDVNEFLTHRSLQRLDDMLRPAIMSGLLSDMLTVSIARHSRNLTQNLYHNGHPDLIVRGMFSSDRVQAGAEGVEIKTTRNRGGSVDTHGARDEWMCVFVYEVDRETEPAIDRASLLFREVYLAKVTTTDFRRNERGPLGTRTASLDRLGKAKLQNGWVYLHRADRA